MNSNQRRKEKRAERRATRQAVKAIAAEQPPAPGAEAASFPERWVGIAEIAERTGRCERTIRNWAREGRIRLGKLGGVSPGMTESDFRAWLRAACRPSEGEAA